MRYVSAIGCAMHYHPWRNAILDGLHLQGGYGENWRNRGHYPGTPRLPQTPSNWRSACACERQDVAMSVGLYPNWCALV